MFTNRKENYKVIKSRVKEIILADAEQAHSFVGIPNDPQIINELFPEELMDQLQALKESIDNIANNPALSEMKQDVQTLKQQANYIEQQIYTVDHFKQTVTSLNNWIMQNSSKMENALKQNKLMLLLKDILLELKYSKANKIDAMNTRRMLLILLKNQPLTNINSSTQNTPWDSYSYVVYSSFTHLSGQKLHVYECYNKNRVLRRVHIFKQQQTIPNTIQLEPQLKEYLRDAGLFTELGTFVYQIKPIEYSNWIDNYIIDKATKVSADELDAWLDIQNWETIGDDINGIWDLYKEWRES